MDSLEGHFMTCLDEPSEHMIKLASNDVITEEMLKTAMPDKNHALIHLIAAGDEEQFGFNRNLDGYPKKAHVERHHTFVSHAKVYQEHDNKDPNKAIGEVKIAAYNPQQSRVELAIWLSKDKAPAEFEMAKEGKQLSFSMGCTVPSDFCSCCGHEAATPADYCSCMKKHAGQWVPEFQKFAYVSNPHPTYKDISEVKRPADRIAHYLGYYFDENEKVAATGNRPVLGVDVAAAYGLVDNGSAGIPFYSLEKQAVYNKLLQAEEAINQEKLSAEFTDLVKKASQDFDETTLDDSHIAAMRAVRPGTLFQKLAAKGVGLDFKTFVAYITGDKLEDIEKNAGYKGACACLPSLFGGIKSMAPDAQMEDLFTANSGMLANCDGGDSDKLDEALKVLASKHSIDPEHLRPRVLHVTIVKQASDLSLNTRKEYSEFANNEWAPLLKAYAHYKVAFCTQVLNNGDNKVTESDLFHPLVIANHF
jgi:hypothetical protein